MSYDAEAADLDAAGAEGWKPAGELTEDERTATDTPTSAGSSGAWWALGICAGLAALTAWRLSSR